MAKAQEQELTTEPKRPFTFKKAERKKTWTLTSIAGLSGSGKTYSAILYARGLVGPGAPIALLDTENERASFYAKVGGGWDGSNMRAPFSPKRYIDAIQAAEAAGYKAMIIDSGSHEWEGDGGVVSMARDIELSTRKAGLHCWNEPKGVWHKRFMQTLLQTRMHLIFCLRVKELNVQKKDEEGKTAIVKEGLVAVQEKMFVYEMTVSMLLDPVTHVPILTKCPEDLLAAFPAGQKITPDTGAAVRRWAEEGVSPNEEVEKFLDIARSAANLGKKNLREFYKTETKRNRTLIQANLAELESIADAADERDRIEAAAAAQEKPAAVHLGVGVPAQKPLERNGQNSWLDEVESAESEQ